jgi:hypothetical protein
MADIKQIAQSKGLPEIEHALFTQLMQKRNFENGSRQWQRLIGYFSFKIYQRQLIKLIADANDFGLFPKYLEEINRLIDLIKRTPGLAPQLWESFSNYQKSGQGKQAEAELLLIGTLLKDETGCGVLPERNGFKALLSLCKELEVGSSEAFSNQNSISLLKAELCHCEDALVADHLNTMIDYFGQLAKGESLDPQREFVSKIINIAKIMPALLKEIGRKGIRS